MASVATISIQEELRPAMCQFANGEWEHGLVHTARIGNHGTFVCEAGGGYMFELPCGSVRFIDGKGKFDEFCWEVDA